MKINNFFLRHLIKVSIQFEKESFFFYLQSMTNNKNENKMASRHIIKLLIQFKYLMQTFIYSLLCIV